jgi:hypothetical protein
MKSLLPGHTCRKKRSLDWDRRAVRKRLAVLIHEVFAGRLASVA